MKPRDARPFYAVIALAVVAVLGMDFRNVDPKAALFYNGVVNGVVAVPVMAVIMLLATRRTVMGRSTIGRWTRRLGIAATALMSLASVVISATL